jgi:hypothetical protein
VDAHQEPVKVETLLLKICHKKRKDVSSPIMQVSIQIFHNNREGVLFLVPRRQFSSRVIIWIHSCASLHTHTHTHTHIFHLISSYSFNLKAKPSGMLCCAIWLSFHPCQQLLTVQHSRGFCCLPVPF